MDFNFLLPLLAMFTLLGALIFSLVNKKQTEDRKKDDSIPPSSLAADGDPHKRAP